MTPNQSVKPTSVGLAYELFNRVTFVLLLIFLSLGTMKTSASEQWSVKIVESGRSGSIEYRELAGSMSFYWEFGGGDTLAIIWIGNAASWSTKYPWAVDRRRTILERVADEVIRQKAPKCRSEIDEKDGYIYIR